jgi:hypothetical protein
MSEDATPVSAVNASPEYPLIIVCSSQKAKF